MYNLKLKDSSWHKNQTLVKYIFIKNVLIVIMVLAGKLMPGSARAHRHGLLGLKNAWDVKVEDRELACHANPEMSPMQILIKG